MAIGGEEEVARFDIAVDNLPLVKTFDGDDLEKNG
jgi:hypothetical protein